ncbi:MULTISPECIES: YcjF family protein [unclassified Inquilinus]|uniref:YcjF family protein n=1 Tax=unclassified Inquilinus TaxID=2645927 RepID=UPI003F90A4C2
MANSTGNKIDADDADAAGPDPVAAAATVETPEELLRGRRAGAEKIVQNYTLMSAGSGLIPIPMIDAAANLIIQLAMLRRLSKHYDVPYSENLGKAAIVALFSSIGGIGAARSIAGSVVKVVPFFGAILGAASVPVTYGAFTFGVGKVFTQHFESGGTFVDFRQETYRKYFEDMFSRGKSIVKRGKSTITGAAAEVA